MGGNNTEGIYSPSYLINDMQPCVSGDIDDSILGLLPMPACLFLADGSISRSNLHYKSVIGKTNFYTLFPSSKASELSAKLEACNTGEKISALQKIDAGGWAVDYRFDISMASSKKKGLFLCIFSEVTCEQTVEQALVSSYKRLETLTAGIKDTIFELADDFTICFANKDYNGVSRSDLRGRSVFDIFCPEACSVFEKALALRNNTEFCFPAQGGLYYKASVRFVSSDPLRVFAVLTLSDETDNYRHTQELICSRNELSKTIEAKDKFMSIIAHDLRAPFSALISFGQLLADTIHEGRTDKSIRLINLINESSLQSYTLLENLLTWTRSQRGILTASLSSFNISEAISDTFELLQSASASKHLKLVQENSQYCLVYADYNMVKTIIRNLVSNSIKFSKDSSGIYAGYSCDGQWLEFYVRDEGIGMHPTILAGLFTQEKPRPQLGTRNEKGSGLGLMVSKEFAELCGGSIRAQSVLGQGTAVYVKLPLKNNEDLN
jgi:signal transduction histidine kinase